MMRVNRKQARDYYEMGHTVRMYPSKINPDSMYGQSFGPIPADEDFTRYENSFMYYNCNEECGRRVHYYVEE